MNSQDVHQAYDMGRKEGRRESAGFLAARDLEIVRLKEENGRLLADLKLVESVRDEEVPMLRSKFETVSHNAIKFSHTIVILEHLLQAVIDEAQTQDAFYGPGGSKLLDDAFEALGQPRKYGTKPEPHGE